MTLLLKCVKDELNSLKHLYQELKAEPTVPKRHPITARRHYHKFYYYTVEKIHGKKKFRYIGGNDSPELKKLARSSYKKELLRVIINNINVLQILLDNYLPYMKGDIIARISPCLSKIDFDAQFDAVMTDLYEWAHAHYDKNPREFRESVILTKDGTRVRSRAECFIYNALLDAGIPFRYEPLVSFERKNTYGEYETVYEAPDFLIKCPDGSYIILEHAGMLSDTQYATNMTAKLQLYQLNGYCIGLSLFVTHDTVNGGIDTSEIDRIIQTIRTRFSYL